MKLATLVLSLVAVLISLGGCANQSRLEQLHRVAKDWCETIRASQVIPVYPLTADLRPGDVFMVQTPIATQAAVYRERGFLPLDDFRTRLDLRADSYSAMYFPGHFDDPHRPGNGHPYPARNGTAIAALAPRAAFPTYSFEAASSGSLALALPIKGVPIGLNFLQADRAVGSVTIADARTYGASPDVVSARLKCWAEYEPIQQMLADTVEASDGRPVYLRVVTRVYLAGQVMVSLENSEVGGFRGRAGNAPSLQTVTASNDTSNNLNAAMRAFEGGQPAPTKPVPGPPPAETATPPEVIDAETGGGAAPPGDRGIDPEGENPLPPPGGGDQTEGSGVDTAPVDPPQPLPGSAGPDAAQGLPAAGGAVQFVWASERSVTMQESFDTLLVVGYLGFDVPVYAGGVLGAPIPTFERLEGRVPTPAVVVRAADDLADVYLDYLERLAADPDDANRAEAARLIATLCARLDDRDISSAAKPVLDALAQGGGGAAEVEEVAPEFSSEVRDYNATGGGNSNVRVDRFNRAFQAAVAARAR